MILGSENIRWDLNSMYSGIEDERIDIDLKTLVDMFKVFNKEYKGKLESLLGKAIEDYSNIRMLENKIMLYLYLMQSANTSDSAVNAKIADTERLLSGISGEYMTFFVIELTAMDDETLSKHYLNDPFVLKHKPWIENQRIFKPHLLSEPVESAITKRYPFGVSAWSEFFDELESDIEAEYCNQKRTLTELLHLMSESKDQNERAELLAVIDNSLKGTFAKYSAQVLYMVTGTSYVENVERSYKTPMDYRNKANHIHDKAVEALHNAVFSSARPLVKKYYSLKAEQLGLKVLKWSDRNAPLPFSDTSIISFDEAKQIVFSAYKSFSPELADFAGSFFDLRRIDAPSYKGKRSGAFNYSVVLPDSLPVSYVMLNYLGSARDVMTLAHELGHGVHGLLAGKKQGVLMSNTPIAYAETASVFGEMITFQFLKERLAKNGDKTSLLSLLMGRIDDVINTTVRQICFSNFERIIHGMDSSYKHWGKPKKFSAAELNDIWLMVTKQFYGEDGEIFTYENAENLWSYIPHFHSPFYVYGYALGELLTQSLYAQRQNIGGNFESLYIDLLSSGDTKDIEELLKPFNLNPSDENFWINGIEKGLGLMIAEADSLWKNIVQRRNS